MASRASWVFAKGAVALIGGGFVTLVWQDVANAAYAAVKGILGQPETALFSPWGSVGMILSGFGLGYLAYRVR